MDAFVRYPRSGRHILSRCFTLSMALMVFAIGCGGTERGIIVSISPESRDALSPELKQLVKDMEQGHVLGKNVSEYAAAIRHASHTLKEKTFTCYRIVVGPSLAKNGDVSVSMIVDNKSGRITEYGSSMPHPTSPLHQ